jgi:uncharacterized protein (DUF1800 family)
MATIDESIRHLLRRAGFGASPQELSYYSELRRSAAIDALVDYEQFDDDVDAFIGAPGYASVTSRGTFSPNTVINDARQRWLFRMIHSARPLQEKMTLFWHNHFATAYTKVAGAYGSSDATRMMAARADEDPAKLQGQVETIRAMCMGSFRDLVVAMAKDPAMLVWLDGRFNTRQKPQENFGRELMELFSMGVGFYREADVYAAARVFTGWNLRRTTTSREDPAPKYEFVYNAGSHDTSAKTFTFPIYPDGGSTIPARAASEGMQDGIDLITAVVGYPATARRLVARLWNYFVSETNPPPEAFVDDLAATYLSSGYNLRPVMRRLLQSADFRSEANYFTKYSWPAEFIARSVKEVGWSGFPVNDAVSQMVNMGQVLYEPPDVAGWEQGAGWISTGGVLARMNFAAQLTRSQAAGLVDAVKPYAKTPDAVLSYFIDRLAPAPYDSGAYDELRSYLTASGAWTGSDAQLRTKVPGLVHLIVGCGEYVFV